MQYQVVYKNGVETPVAEFRRDPNGGFVFEYLDDNPKYEFPGFNRATKKYSSDILWEQIAFRVPNEIRYEHPDTPLEELLSLTKGQLVTDHFEFKLLE